MLRLFSRKKTTTRKMLTKDSEELIADLKLQLLRTEKERDIAMSRMLRLFSRKKTTTRKMLTKDSEELIAELKLQLLRTEKERDIAMSRKEADEEQLDKLREKVRELAYELQDAKDLILSERSLRFERIFQPSCIIYLCIQATVVVHRTCTSMYIDRKEADEEQLDKLREKVRELAYELQDAKDLILSERSLRESTLSVEAIAVIELNDQIARCHTQIGQLRLMLKNCESKRKALSIQLSVLNDKLQRSEYLRREANRRWRSAEISAIEWRKRALTSERIEHTIKHFIERDRNFRNERMHSIRKSGRSGAYYANQLCHQLYETTPRLSRPSIDRSSKIAMPNLPKRLFECNQQY
uniref:Cilia- and flagella-associated protein 157 n=1 Tax=Ascaris lumbricoides TaxID=6252 RepID=A0A0M3IFS6_ASCLU